MSHSPFPSAKNDSQVSKSHTWACSVWPQIKQIKNILNALKKINELKKD